MQFGPYYCPSLSWEWGWGAPPSPPHHHTKLRLFTKNSSAGSVVAACAVDLQCGVGPQKPSLPIHPPEGRLPEHIATETLLPHLFFPSLTVQLCRPGAIASACLAALQHWGKGHQLTYGFLCIIALLLAHQLWHLSWKTAPSRPPFLRQCAFASASLTLNSPIVQSSPA